jgi:hypothetical protein
MLALPEGGMTTPRIEDPSAPETAGQGVGCRNTILPQIGHFDATTEFLHPTCDGVLPLLDRAQTILGNQPQIDQLRATCTGPPGHRPGHGHGNG